MQKTQAKQATTKDWAIAMTLLISWLIVVGYAALIIKNALGRF